MEESREYWEQELKRVCKQISELPFNVSPSKDEKAYSTRLWNKKRSIVAKLNQYNYDKNYVNV